MESRVLAPTRIALIGPNFFSYIDGIRRKMLEKGLDVESFDERHSNTPFVKALYRLGYYRLFAERRQQHLADIAAKLVAGRFSDVLLINVEVPDRPFVQRIVDAGLRVHIYMWDSTLNKPGYVEFLDLLQGKASFDPRDCAKLGLRYVPLFADDTFSGKRPPRTSAQYEPVIDIFFCGTLHSNRAKLIAELEHYSNKRKLQLSMLLYFHSRWMFAIKSLVIHSNILFILRVSSKIFPKHQICESFQRAKFVFDLPHPGQTGLTARTFEVLRTGTRLITFNAQAYSLLPKSLSERVTVIERISDLDKIDFKNAAALAPLSKEDEHYLSIERFVDEMIDLITKSS